MLQSPFSFLAMQRTFVAKENDTKVSPGEFVAQNPVPVNFKHMPTQTLEDSFVSDSDENNNSEQNSSIGEVRNKVNFTEFFCSYLAKGVASIKFFEIRAL